jgi:UDP-N-acetylglucosamine 2-epimerase (non-hydrolysing)
MKILTVVGARPNFMKAAPIIAAINEHNGRFLADSADIAEQQVETIRHILVHTGQHYDELMSGSFFSDLNLPKPDIHLGVGSGSHAVQTAEIMKKFEEVLMREKPDVMMVVGDVNSTLACALVTSKISFDSVGSRPVIVHVEAGLRSFDRSMPEEINRILTDHVSDLLFVTEESGLQNLRNEGVSLDKIHFAGNTMIDSLLNFKEKAEASDILEKLGFLRQVGKNGGANSITPYALLTLHRPSNVDNRDVFLNILAGLEELARNYPVVFPVHPRTQRRIREFKFAFRLGATARKHQGNARASRNRCNGIVLTDPLGYLDFLCLMKHATLVVTDSGGIQEETTILGIPCVTVRENTERPVTVESGTNTIAGTKTDNIKDAIRRQMGGKRKAGVPKNWDGHAAARIIDVLVRRHCEKTSSRPSFVPHVELLEGRCPGREPNLCL